MKEFNLWHLSNTIKDMDLIHFSSVIPDEVVEESEKKRYLQSFERFGSLCSSLGLRVSASMVNDVIGALSRRNLTSSNLYKNCDILWIAFRKEAEQTKWFSIESDKFPFISDKNLFGINVANAFPSAMFDIEEAGKCMAFERWTSAVFHLMRIAEIATVIIGKRVGYRSHKEGFGEVLKYLDSQLALKDKDRAEQFKGDMEFLSTITAQMHAVNQAWRQRVSHLDKKYTSEEAYRIWDATKGLLQAMATKLLDSTDA